MLKEELHYSYLNKKLVNYKIIKIILLKEKD